MTRAVVSGMASAMFRSGWCLVLVLLAASLVTTATVHARELPAPLAQELTLECNGSVHNEDERERPVGDSDQAPPHHHGTCHGQAVVLPSDDGGANAFANSGQPPVSGKVPALPTRSVDPALRPPAA